MTPDAWHDDDGPRFEKLRHNVKFHGRGRKHNPLRGMTGAHRVGIAQVNDRVNADRRLAKRIRDRYAE